MKKLIRKTQTCSSGTYNRKLSALSIFIFSPLFMLAQLGGIWYGELENDSTHKKQSFELGLSEYRGKITGYSYTTFIDNDTFYYSIKKIKAEKKDGLLIITDDEMVGNNFPERAAKGVKQTTVFPLITDSTFDITKGSWTTNRTKKYYSIKGSAQVQEMENRNESDLIAHLEEMKVKTDITTKKPIKKNDEVVVKNKSGIKDQNSLLTNRNEEPVKKTELAAAIIQKPEIRSSPQLENKNKTVVKKDSVVVNPIAVQKPQPQQTNNSVVVNKQTAPIMVKQVSQNPVAQKTEQIVIDNSKIESQKTVASKLVNTEKLEAKPLPQFVANRSNETIQQLYFHSDSLVLSLYDNGVVDGDTVSVFLNGNAIVSKQMLKVSAYKKTVYITPDMDSVQLVLFADNLGSIPPNTGLLTVRDGDQTYNVRFSADLQKNAAIVLRRKKNQ